MKKILTGALAALTAASALAISAAPASARDWDDRGGWGWRHDNDGGAAVAAGIAGLAIGAAIAGDHPYYGGYYGYAPAPVYYDAPPPAYYVGPSYYGYYGRCHAQWRWDPYWRRYVRVRACY